MNPKTELWAIPVNESVRDLAKVNAGFANAPEGANSIAPPSHSGTQTCGPPRRSDRVTAVSTKINHAEATTSLIKSPVPALT